jgi:hypothetical protein
MAATSRVCATAGNIGPPDVTDGDGEAAEIEQLRAEVAALRAENEALRERAAELVGAEMALNHLLREARAVRGGRRRDPVQLLGEPTAGSA